MSNAERYIEKYKELERTVRRVYKLPREKSISYYLKEQTPFGKYREQITCCQEVRNFLQHEQKIGGDFAVQPSEQMIAFVDDLIRQLNARPTCRQLATPFGKLYWQNPESRLTTAIRAMNQKGYALIPILSDKRVVGVLNGRRVLAYLADHGAPGDDLRLGEIAEYTALERYPRERFLFVPQSLRAEELAARFESEFKGGRLVAAAFLTANGKPEETITGMLTPWSLLGAGE